MAARERSRRRSAAIVACLKRKQRSQPASCLLFKPFQHTVEHAYGGIQVKATQVRLARGRRCVKVAFHWSYHLRSNFLRAPNRTYPTKRTGRITRHPGRFRRRSPYTSQEEPWNMQGAAREAAEAPGLEAGREREAAEAACRASSGCRASSVIDPGQCVGIGSFGEIFECVVLVLGIGNEYGRCWLG